jgi:hypothetical protein
MLHIIDTIVASSVLLRFPFRQISTTDPVVITDANDINGEGFKADLNNELGTSVIPNLALSIMKFPSNDMLASVVLALWCSESTINASKNFETMTQC